MRLSASPLPSTRRLESTVVRTRSSFLHLLAGACLGDVSLQLPIPTGAQLLIRAHQAGPSAPQPSRGDHRKQTAIQSTDKSADTGAHTQSHRATLSRWQQQQQQSRASAENGSTVTRESAKQATRQFLGHAFESADGRRRPGKLDQLAEQLWIPPQ
ncbi:hypothetical protein CBS101457_002955 [Exobasidium rhododendri]|nr:hypothetical protein CBS101457_002955 [Exobasidium rhododendri]